jgi:hypothetical protein
LSKKSTQNRIQWRRDKVRELSTKGYTQRDIATELKVSLKLVNKDLLNMREQSKNNIQHYIDERLPTEYENAISTLDMIAKEMWELKPDNNRDLIQSRALIKECTVTKIEFIASGTVVDRAMKFVERHRPTVLPGSTNLSDKVSIDG